MQITDVSAFHIVTEIKQANFDTEISKHTPDGYIKTVQSIILKAPENHESEFIIKTEKSGGARTAIINVLVEKNSTKILSVKQQLPASIGMYACASAGGVVTINGVDAKLGD